MLPLTLEEIAVACGGRLDGAEPGAVATAVAIDSRMAAPGSLFVALPGDRADGHEFVADALRAGAVAALVNGRPVEGGSLVRVDDPLRALAELAARVRGRLRAPVIAITGSSGKTSTKDLTAAALGTTKRVVASAESYNNEIGVPLTILDAGADTDVLVVEVGSRGLGHIARLASVVRPDVAVVTNVGPAHLGMFGSLETTARAKGELIEALEPGGVAVLNADDPLVAGLAVRTGSPVRTFGLGAGADVRGVEVALDSDARASFAIESGAERAQLSLRIPGEHMVRNALAAAAAALVTGVPLAAAAAGMAICEPAAWRMQVLHTPRGRRILNDAYNANPDSMGAALKTLVAMAGGRPTWAVIGPMAELGDATEREHDRIGRLAVRLGIRHVLTVGEEARATHQAARLEGSVGPDEALLARDVDEALAILREKVEPDAVVLVKASRAAGLERIAEALGEDA